MDYWIVSASVEFAENEDGTLIAKVKMPLSQLQNGEVCGSTPIDHLPDDLSRFAERLIGMEIEWMWLRRICVCSPSGETAEYQHSIMGDRGDPIAVTQGLLNRIAQILEKA